MAEAKKEELVIRSGTFIGAQYSQVVGVTITDNDLTLEFIYVNPRVNVDGKKNAEVVARVTLPVDAARGLAETIDSTLVKHFSKKGQ